MVIVMYMNALLLGQSLCTYLADDIDNIVLDKDIVYLYYKYGTGIRSFYTTFEMTFSGCWPTFLWPFISRVSWVYGLYFLFYVYFVVFAITRIITALFLKETLNIAAADSDMMVQENLRSTQSYTRKLSELFEAMDISGDGRLNFREFDSLLSMPE